MKNLDEYAAEVHKANAKWWIDITKLCNDCANRKEQFGMAPFLTCTYCHGLGYAPLENRNVGELLMLVVTELSEAMEGHRKSLADDKLPHRKMFEVEIADAMIRLFDISAGFNLDLEGAYQEKMKYNASRADHSIEHRLQPGGKKY